MTTINLGPLAFPASLFVFLLAVIAASVVAGLMDRRRGSNVESILWKTVLAGALIARITFVLLHLESYLQRPISMMDIRDGGFSVWAGVLAAILVAGLLVWPRPLARRPLALAGATALSVLGMGYAIITLLYPAGTMLGDIHFTTLQGEPVKINNFQGKPTVINLWASWCPPCRREMPALQQGQAQNPDMNFIFANQRETDRVIRAYLEDENLALDNVLLDRQGELAREIGSNGLPTTLFLDARGRLVDVRVGELSAATLNDRLNALRTGIPAIRRTQE